MITIKEDKIFCVETDRTGYYMQVRGGLVENLHYGSKIHCAIEPLQEKMTVGYGTDVVYQKDETPLSLLHLCLELSPEGKGDYRKSALSLSEANGNCVVDFHFVSAKKEEGCPSFEELPSTKGCPDAQMLPTALGGEETLTLEFASAKGIKVFLYYTTYPDCDVIT